MHVFAYSLRIPVSRHDSRYACISFFIDTYVLPFSAYESGCLIFLLPLIECLRNRTNPESVICILWLFRDYLFSTVLQPISQRRVLVSLQSKSNEQDMKMGHEYGERISKQNLMQKVLSMTQNENYVGWAEDDGVDMQLLLSVSTNGLTTANKENVLPATATTSISATSPMLAPEPLSLFHSKRKRALKATEDRNKKTSAAGKSTKELSPYTATLERSLQQRRLHRSKRRSTAGKDQIDLRKQEISKEEDPFGDLLDLDDSDFAAIDDLVLSYENSAVSSTTVQQEIPQREQNQPKSVDLFDEIPDEVFFGAVIDPSDVQHPIGEFQPLELPPDFKNPKTTHSVQNFSYCFMFSRYVVAHVHEVVQQHIKHLFVFPHNLEHHVQTCGVPPSKCKQISLAGEWFYTHVKCGDVVHIVSPSGQWQTDFSALPLSLKSHCEDDILLVVEPDVLVAPTLISEALGCSRRAVLRHRMGSGPFSSK